MENNKNKKSVKFQEGMFNFCDIIQVFVFTRNHHLKYLHTAKNIRRFNGKITGNQLPVHFSFLRAPVNILGIMHSTAKRHVLLLVI